ncbi:hypothetical protein MKW94_012815 [Papaver nudicaule]|uniref:EXPERA domain-containing protein n=1 Tax=Papaver nudicaule TaxID=74823 RepID=A0AA41S2G3_PAPNU|nr:hypothetical protein [Papaver nudicaule]
MLLQKLTDGLLFIYFLFCSFLAPLLDAQIILPIEFFPKFLVDLHSRYAEEFNDCLISEKPHFFVGLFWVDILILWPICIANLYGILNKKSWVKQTCLIYGVSAATGMVAILSELIRSGREGSSKVVSIYAPFMVFAIISILNGLTTSSKSSSTVAGPAMGRKKRA